MSLRSKRWISSLLAAVMLVSVPVGGSPIIGYAQTKETNQTQQKKPYQQLRQAFIDALDIAKNETTEEHIRQAIDAFMELPSLSDYPDPAYVDDKRVFPDEILALLPLVEDKNEQNELYVYFATKALKKAKETAHHFDMGVAEKVVTSMPPGDERTKLATEMEQVQKEVFGKMRDDYIDWYNPPEDLVIVPYVPPVEDNPSFEEVYGKKPEPQKPIANYDRASSKYVSEGGKCLKITEYYKSDKLVDTKKEVTSDAEKIFCGVLFDDEHFHNDGDHVGSAFQWIVPNMSADYMNNTGSSNQNNNGQNEAKSQSITIHYTFEKDSESPYYFDSGIAINKDKTMSYDQAKDALHHIAIHAKGKFAEDKNKALALIDGVIVLLVDSGRPITMQEFASLFADTIVEVKALDTRSGMNMSLADLVESKKIQSIYIGNKKVNLHAPLMVENSVVLFPIEQIAEELGGKVTHQAKQSVIEYKDQKLIYEDGKYVATINNKEINLNAEIKTNKDGIRMAPIKALLNAFGRTLEIDNETSTIYIN